MKTRPSDTPVMPPEFRLLAPCAWLERENRPEQSQAVAALLRAGIDAAAFRALVERHRLPVLAHIVLSRAVRDANLDIAWIGGLEHAARAARMRALRLDSEWRQLEDRCRQAGIRVRALKGTALSQRLYEDIGIRHSRDIDVLVSPADCEKMLALMRPAGYVIDPAMLPHRRPGAQMRLYRRLGYHINCRTPGGLPLELHTHVERFGNSRLEETWAQLAWSSGEAPQNRFDLLYGVLHGSVHGWSRLKWLGDARLMVERLTDLDWPAVIADAASLRLQTLLAEALILLEWVTGFVLPPRARPVVEAAGKPGLSLARQAFGWMMAPEARLSGAATSDILRACYLSWRVGRRLPAWEQAQYWLMRALFSSSDLLHIELPAALTVLYPVIRPCTMLRRCFFMKPPRLQ